MFVAVTLRATASGHWNALHPGDLHIEHLSGVDWVAGDYLCPGNAVVEHDAGPARLTPTMSTASNDVAIFLTDLLDLTDTETLPGSSGGTSCRCATSGRNGSECTIPLPGATVAARFPTGIRCHTGRVTSPSRNPH